MTLQFTMKEMKKNILGVDLNSTTTSRRVAFVCAYQQQTQDSLLLLQLGLPLTGCCPLKA